MKKIITLTVFILLGLAHVFSQVKPVENMAQENYFKFQARLKGGIGWALHALPLEFDTVIIKNPVRQDSYIETGLKNDFLKTKLGPYGGVNFDFYFHPNFGFGLDGDFFYNKLEFIVPDRLQDLISEYSLKDLVETNRKNQYFIYAGMGPSFKLFTNEHWDIDLNLRGGLSVLQMGSLYVGFDESDTALPWPPSRSRLSVLEYDYSKIKLAFGAKAGLYVNYWFNSWIGITLGADYIHSFVNAGKIADDDEYILNYKDPDYFNDVEGAGFDGFAYFYEKNLLDKYPVKKMNVNHVSVSAGVVFRLAEVAKAGPKNKDILVLVKDSLTGIPIEEADVSLKDKVGRVILIKKTGANGKATFEDVAPGDYTVSATKDDLKTRHSPIAKDEFLKHKKVIYRELLLPGHKFILAGLTVECNKSDKPINNVNIELTNKSTGKVEKAVSDANGKFTFTLEQNTDYSIVGNRDMYFSGIQDITTKGLNRDKTLYVKLILCVDQLEVGKSFVLKNIYYDFDKCDIRKDASVELDRLVDIMKKYPTMEIELSSHTDQRGSDAYNNKLSQCRAESAVNYILSKGISKSRITAIGYGKTRILKDCYKEAGCSPSAQTDCPCHQENRRTEVKILKM